MKLDILIPTYNRGKYLIKNLSNLSRAITEIGSDICQISVIVSDNASDDGTEKMVQDYMNSSSCSLNLSYHRNESNLGYSANLKQAIAYSDSDYIMFLGDDDYIQTEYLKTAIARIHRDNDIVCVMPSFQAIDENGYPLGWGRDLDETSRLYEPGIRNFIDNSQRAHQISGIITKRDGLHSAMIEHGINNLYPQIFAVAYWSLRGKTLHLPEFPVSVTQTMKKAWRYDDVGLLNDVFENFKYHGLSSMSRAKAEAHFIARQSWRAMRYGKYPLKQISVIWRIAFGPNTSAVGHCVLPFVIGRYWAAFLWYRIKSKLKKRKA